MMAMTDKTKNYVLLHFLILLGSFVPTMVSWIQVLSSVQLVFIRVVIAFVILSGLVYFNKHNLKVPRKQIQTLVLSGSLLASYWVLLVVATKVSNASVTLIGIAVAPIWVTFILPFFNGGRPNFYQFMTGINAGFGIYMISSNDFDYTLGMIVAIAAAFFAALVMVISSKFVQNHHHTVITFYQMAGAVIFLTFCLPFESTITGNDSSFSDAPVSDYVIAAAMAYLFSVFAYSLTISVMKKISAFTVTLSNNLVPVYGILIALVLSSKDEKMNLYFYSGATIIVASVIAFPIVQLFFKSIPSENTQIVKEKKKKKVDKELEAIRKAIEAEEAEKENRKD